MAWIEKLKTRWNLTSGWQVIIILVVFACTGFTVLFLKQPIVAYFTEDGNTSISFTIVYYILILPVYFMFLLIYGFLFGQLDFFWGFVKKTFGRMSGKKRD